MSFKFSGNKINDLCSTVNNLLIITKNIMGCKYVKRKLSCTHTWICARKHTTHTHTHTHTDTHIDGETRIRTHRTNVPKGCEYSTVHQILRCLPWQIGPSWQRVFEVTVTPVEEGHTAGRDVTLHHSILHSLTTALYQYCCTYLEDCLSTPGVVSLGGTLVSWWGLSSTYAIGML